MRTLPTPSNACRGPCLRTLALGLCVSIAGCVEPFTPAAEQSPKLLVVEGHISSDTAPYSIRLSRTQPLDAAGSVPESGATVVVSNDEGTNFEFTEVAPGLYQSDPDCFVGIVGSKYKLRVLTSEGRDYESHPVTLKATPPIDSVYYERDIRLTDVTGEELDGVKILVDSHDPQKQTRYYRYEWTETYQIKVPYPSQWELSPDYAFVLVEFFQICYNSAASKTILTAYTGQLAEDRVSGFELNFVSTVSYRLRSRYSLLVRQYALDAAGYRYWNELSKNSSNLGTLFDPVPYQLTGNVVNLDDPDEPVLGYFDASAISEKRIYVDRESLDALGVTYPLHPCIHELDTVKGGFNELLLRLSWGQKVVSIPGLGTGALVTASPECTDCRLLASTEQPAFWEE